MKKLTYEQKEKLAFKIVNEMDTDTLIGFAVDRVLDNWKNHPDWLEEDVETNYPELAEEAMKDGQTES